MNEMGKQRPGLSLARIVAKKKEEDAEGKEMSVEKVITKSSLAGAKKFDRVAWQ